MAVFLYVDAYPGMGEQCATMFFISLVDRDAFGVAAALAIAGWMVEDKGRKRERMPHLKCIKRGKTKEIKRFYPFRVKTNLPCSIILICRDFER